MVIMGQTDDDEGGIRGGLSAYTNYYFLGPVSCHGVLKKKTTR